MANKAQIDRVLSLRREDGEFRTEDIIEDAKQPDSPLHTYFNWDLERAAYEHWKDQARQLISEVRVIITHGATTVTTYRFQPSSPSVSAGNQGGYVDVTKVTKRKTQRELLDAELRQLQGHMERLIRLAFTYKLHEAYRDRMHETVDTAYSRVIR